MYPSLHNEEVAGSHIEHIERFISRPKDWHARLSWVWQRGAEIVSGLLVKRTCGLLLSGEGGVSVVCSSGLSGGTSFLEPSSGLPPDTSTNRYHILLEIITVLSEWTNAKLAGILEILSRCENMVHTSSNYHTDPCLDPCEPGMRGMTLRP